MALRKVLGLLTGDFRLYHDLVGSLKARGIPFRSLNRGEPIPRDGGAVLTSPAEAPEVPFPEVVAVDRIEDAIARAHQVLRGRHRWREFVIGVDPGGEPGVAFVGGDADAAVEIARGHGVRAARYYAVEPTAGEVREIQRRSRLASGGEVTISQG